MTDRLEHVGGINCDRAHESCDDQLPTISRVGRGIKGDTYRVTVQRQDSDEMYLVGESYDQASKTWTVEWASNNLSGGELLEVEYNFMPSTTPPTFTMTFIYRHPSTPGKDGSPYKEWSWTTPAIPYFPADPEATNFIGSGIANLYIREGSDPVKYPWKDSHRFGTDPPLPVTNSTGRWGQLRWPLGTEPKDFRTPSPDEKWSASITFGVGGDVEIPNIDDIAKVLGITRQQFVNIVNGTTQVIKPPTGWGDSGGSDNVKDYIDDQDNWVMRHIHTDMGFGGPFGNGVLIGCTPSSIVPRMRITGTGTAARVLQIYNGTAWIDYTRAADDQPYTIKNYVDYLFGEGLDYTDASYDRMKAYVDDAIDNLQDQIDDINTKLGNNDKTLKDIIAKFYGGGTIGSDGSVTWNGPSGSAAIGNMNIYSGDTAPTATANYIRAAADGDDDLWAK